MQSSLRQDVGEAVALLRNGVQNSAPIRLSEFRWLVGHLAPYRARIALAVALMIASSILGVLQPLAAMIVVDKVVPARDHRMLAWVVAGLTAIYLAKPFLSFLSSYQFTVLGQSVQTSVRIALFRHLLRLPLAFFEKSQSGYLTARLNEVSAVSILFSNLILTPLLSVLEFVSGVALMYLVSWRLALVVTPLLPVMYVVARLQTRGLRVATRAWMEQGAAVSRHVQESLSGVQTIKEHAAEDRESQKIAASLAKLLRTGIVQSVAGSLASESVNTIAALTGVLVLWFGARSMIDGSLTVGSYIAFSAYAVKFIGPIQMLAALSFGLQPAFTGVRRLSELMDQVAEDTGRSGERLDRIEGRIRFEDVHFAYDTAEGRVAALRGVSLVVEPGERIAIVGPSGSGKTTLIRLLLGLYRPVAGTIRIDGRDLREIRLGDLRDRIGIVSQQVFLFNDTLRNNILYSRPDATAADLEEAVKAAAADRFIAQLPDGYDTAVGERGLRLSGGELQRISIARALLKKPDLVIFDEATSQLDGESERRVWREAERHLAGRTCLIVSHRLNPVLTADRVVFVDDGRVIADGCHEDLLRSNARYRDLFSTTGAA